MGLIGTLTTFVAHTDAIASEVNANFTEIKSKFNSYAVLTDTAKTIAVTHTYSASQTFAAGWTAGAGCTVSSGGLTVTAGGLVVTAGGLTVSAGTTAVQALTCTTLTASGVGTVASLVCAGTTTLHGVALTWPASNASGYLKNNGSGTLSWDTAVIVSASGLSSNVIPKASSASALAASNLTDDGTTVTLASGKWFTLTTQPFCSVYNNTTQTINNGSVTDLTFDSEFTDALTMHSTSSNTNRITIPSNGGGLYLLIARFNGLGGSIDAAATAGFSKNGTLLNASRASIYIPGTTGSSSTMVFVTTLAAADYVTVSVSNPGTVNMTVYNQPEFHVVRLY